MELPETLLQPIPGPNPSGQNLRWDPVYEKVKEARREEDDLPQGEWSRSVKTADPALVIKLTIDALSNKSKDLQLAAWLTEALLRQEGASGLKKGLELQLKLIEGFWDTIYPLPEDGDVELRTAPLNWVASYLADAVKRTPITQSDYDWLHYTESRAIGYEEACRGNEKKMAARQAAIEEKKVTPEEFDADANATPASFYTALVRGLDDSTSALSQLDAVCKEKLGRDSPNFGRLQEAVEEIRSLASSFLQREGHPDENEAVQAQEPEQEQGSLAETTPSHARVGKKASGASEPIDRDDANRIIVRAASYLQKLEPSSPAPYMILRGLRWGELRAAAYAGLSELEPPPSEVRQSLKRLSVEGLWNELLEAAEDAMALPCGKAWLDLQRYVVSACQEMGSDYSALATAIRTGVAGLVTDIPDLPLAVFIDDTPVANAETQAWIKELMPVVSKAIEESEPESEPEIVIQPPNTVESSEQTPDVEVLAMQAVRAGRVQEGLEMLSKEIAQVQSGRQRFQRKSQLANLCLSTGRESIAYPILKDLAQEIEARKLEEWEPPPMLANALILFYLCLQKNGADPKEKDAVYQRICRLDPVRFVTLKH